MTDITIHGFPQSSFTWTARMTAEEKGIGHDLQPVEFGAQSHQALHPFVRMPAMTHGDLTLYETTAITAYIDEAFEGPALQPADPAPRARMNQWVSAFNDYFYGPMTRDVIIQRLVVPSRGGESDESVIAAGAAIAKDRLAVVEAALAATPYLAGDDATLADFFFAPALWWLDKTPEGAAILPGLAAIADWRQRLEARAAFQATIPPMPQEAAAA